jgi:hypothetical protein
MNWLKRLFSRPSAPEADMQRVLESVKKGLGPELAGVLAYGSWASGEFIEGYSNIDLLILTRRLDAETMKRMAPIASLWRNLNGVKPRVFSMQELKAFSEALPMEFGDIAENRRLLYGEDPFLKMQVSQARLVDELEAEIRNRLVKLRQRYLLCGGAPDELRSLLIGVTASFFPVLRAFLRLKNRRAPRQRVRLIEECCRNYRFSRRTLLQAHDLRYGRKNAERLDVTDLFNRIVLELQLMADQASRMRGASPVSGHAASPPRAYAEGGEGQDGRSDRGDRGDRSERGDRRDRERGRDRDRSERGGRSGGGDRSQKLAQVRQLMQEASSRKKWEPKEPERFVADEFSRDTTLSPGARFGWDRAWQSERRAKGYVPVLEPKEPVAEEEPYTDEELEPQAALQEELAAPVTAAPEVIESEPVSGQESVAASPQE